AEVARRSYRPYEHLGSRQSDLPLLLAGVLGTAIIIGSIGFVAYFGAPADDLGSSVRALLTDAPKSLPGSALTEPVRFSSEDDFSDREQVTSVETPFEIISTAREQDTVVAIVPDQARAAAEGDIEADSFSWGQTKQSMWNCTRAESSVPHFTSNPVTSATERCERAGWSRGTYNKLHWDGAW
ncbi:MAG: hypothetical protein KDD44_08850, partial [Bdellovibrionales bacterium]|nr:hypothetical protein [Bdellovibrionales bacterium]